MKPRIAVDGPAGAGKSTVARAVAKKLGLLYLDTGAMYRAITLEALRRGVDVNDGDALEELTRQCSLDIKKNEADGSNLVFLNGEDVSEQIRTPQVNRNVSYVARCPQVRAIMAELQQDFGRRGGVVMDGRDIGTHVMPEAEYKFFLTASLEERARRRLAELLAKGEKLDLDQMIKEIAARDKIDSERECAPLKAAPDAVVIDTTKMTVEEVVNEIVNRVLG